MASSSVSQDDIDNDYEKNSRRSRIRTARARQINPSGSRADNNTYPHDEAEERALDNNPAAAATAALNEEEEAAYMQAAEGAGQGDGARGADPGGADDTSPKPMCRAKDKRVLPPSKLHHANKGKQQRDRRKLREKRRSTGVVHLASTESTGGSTTGDDEGTADTASEAPQERAPSALPLTLETRRNTQQNECIANSYRQAQEKLAQEVDTERSGCTVPADPAPHSNGNEARSGAAAVAAAAASSRRTRRDKSPSDLEADDENDHDSLNQSETGSGSNLSVCNLAMEQQRRFTDASATSSQRSANPSACALDQMKRENKHLATLVEEKDRRIHLLEYKVQQLMRDTLTISEEQSRLQKENTTLLRALSKLTKDKASASSAKS